VIGDGAPDIIKVLDFGGASFACKRTGRCTPEPRSGALGSLAPELLAGETFDCRVDIFALGLLMYRLTTNRMTYIQGSTAGELGPGRTVPFAVSPEFEAVVLKALALDPDQRHANAQEMYDALVVAEQTSRPPSRLPDDPLHWADEEWLRTAANGKPVFTELADPDVGVSSPRWRSAPSRTAVVVVAVVALVATTAALQTAWNLLT
jgi:serine/threonine-protein kinase